MARGVTGLFSGKCDCFNSFPGCHLLRPLKDQAEKELYRSDRSVR